MNPDDRDRLERIKKTARRLGSCLDARDHGDEAWARENEPRYIATIGDELRALSEPLRSTLGSVRLRDATDWHDLYRAVERLLLPDSDLERLLRVRSLLDRVDDVKEESETTEARAAVLTLLDELTAPIREKVPGVEAWAKGNASWHVASDSLWSLAILRGEGAKEKDGSS